MDIGDSERGTVEGNEEWKKSTYWVQHTLLGWQVHWNPWLYYYTIHLYNQKPIVPPLKLLKKNKVSVTYIKGFKVLGKEVGISWGEDVLVRVAVMNNKIKQRQVIWKIKPEKKKERGDALEHLESGRRGRGDTL